MKQAQVSPSQLAKLLAILHPVTMADPKDLHAEASSLKSVAEDILIVLCTMLCPAVTLILCLILSVCKGN